MTKRRSLLRSRLRTLALRRTLARWLATNLRT